MVAFAIIFMGVMILFAGLFIIADNVIFNEFITFGNMFISSGEVSKQFVTYWNVLIGIVIAFPIMFLLSITIWGIVRAIERRQEST